MSKSQSPSDRARAARRLADDLPTPSAPTRRSRLWPVVLGVLLVVAVVAGCITYFQMTTNKEPASEELDLCRRFMDLKNAGDPAADKLLGPAPVAPTEAVSPEEADRLHAEFFLRGDYSVVKVRPESAEVSGPDSRIILELKGAVSSPRIPQVGPNGTDVFNRAMAHPDIVVRVVDGKIRAVVAQMHEDANAKPMSEENKRRLREYLGERRR
jgi:hypothetical protein